MQVLEVEYLKNDAFYGQSYYRTLIGNRTRAVEWYHFQWPWLTHKRVARVSQHELSFLLTFVMYTRRNDILWCHSAVSGLHTEVTMRKYVQIVDLYKAGLQKPRFFGNFLKVF